MDPYDYRTFDRDSNTARYQFNSDLPDRPGLNKSGKQVQIRVNQYKVTDFPTRDVFQYDINIGTGAEKMGKIMAVWKSQTVQMKLNEVGAPFLWDGNKLAWSSASIEQIRVNVDLDAEKGRQPREGKAPDTCFCIIKRTKVIRMAVIAAYLAKKTPFDNSVFEAINFFDHAMRQWPSDKYVTVKRSFFARSGKPTPLDNYVMAIRGVYASMRLCDPNPSIGGVGTGLGVNIDTANMAFWSEQDVHQAAKAILGGNNPSYDYHTMVQRLAPVPSGNKFVYSESFKNLRIMAKLKFKVKWNAKNDPKRANKTHKIKGFLFKSEMGKVGANAKTFTFPLKDRQTGKEQNISVYDYFKRKYGVDLKHWQLPLINTERDGVFPMEACRLEPYQKFQYKLSPDQTASMIKFAVTRPPQRLQGIDQGIKMLNWPQDPYLKHFGIKIDPNMTVTNARVLQNPEVQYKNTKINPGTSGKWDLRGKKLWLPNPEPLKSWGFLVINSCIDESSLQNFISVFVQTYIGHGGNVTNKRPTIHSAARGEDVAQAALAARQKAGNQAQAIPSIIFVVLPSRDSTVYQRLKRGLECRFGTVSQMLAVGHVLKANPQYCSNVVMKVNSKLGGTTCKIVTVKSKQFFSTPTMVVGVDVSHGAQYSTAAITMSQDLDACRYAAYVNTNGRRVEMLTPGNIQSGFVYLFEAWCQKHNTAPAHIYYFRDGVSEGQYAHVLEQEVKGMNDALLEKFGAAKIGKILWTVTICSKRHHIRFFPKEGDYQAGDPKGNSLPGTLVERDVTHPFEYDFYLSSHSAIQGTARPVHYHVIKDDAHVPPTVFQDMVYKHCYQYARSTTPVSLYPAVYYAHLAAYRALCHDSSAASDGPRTGQKYEENQQDAAVRDSGADTSQTGSAVIGSEVKPLVPLGKDLKNPELIKAIRTSMWYI
ncbi:Piwi domain-containing protein [Amylocarpus encephaloides]|uniref:Piwi domain-containing protein n=1 Tax=Amylocarpus encephaloides TaxID=45428 RepID=A0A9P7YFV4_9HELO|nr:Piwi domain-containing protein [Amylocarpus encephaloides]